MWKTYIVIFSEKTTVFWFYNLAISAIRKGLTSDPTAAICDLFTDKTVSKRFILLR